MVRRLEAQGKRPEYGIYCWWAEGMGFYAGLAEKGGKADRKDRDKSDVSKGGKQTIKAAYLR